MRSVFRHVRWPRSLEVEGERNPAPRRCDFSDYHATERGNGLNPQAGRPLARATLPAAHRRDAPSRDSPRAPLSEADAPPPGTENTRSYPTASPHPAVCSRLASHSLTTTLRTHHTLQSSSNTPFFEHMFGLSLTYEKRCQRVNMVFRQAQVAAPLRGATTEGCAAWSRVQHMICSKLNCWTR